MMTDTLLRAHSPAGPIGDIAVDADTGAIVVTHFGDDAISVIDPATLEVRGAVGVEGEPFAAVVADDRAYVSTASARYDGVSVIDVNSHAVIATYPLAFSVSSLAISPDGKRVFAGRTADDGVDVAVIDITAERIGTIALAAATGAGRGIAAVRVDPGGRRLYVATSDVACSQVVTVDTGTTRVQRTWETGSVIRDFAVGPDGTAYVLTSDRTRGGAVDVVDLAANEVIDTVVIGGAPTQLTSSPDGTRLYVTDYDQVVVLGTLTAAVIDTVATGTRPSCVAVSPDGGRLYVADYAGAVTAFDVASTAEASWSRAAA